LNQQTVRLKTDHWLLNQKIAHRGFHNQEIPENSLLAFQHAIDHHFAIELDIHLLKDSEVIVFHDEDLQRMTGSNLKIKDLEIIDLQNHKLGNTSETIPTLLEVLNLVNGQVPIIIEIKNTGLVGKLERSCYSILQNYNGPFAIQSFNPLSLAWFRLNLPNTPRGMLSTLDLDHLNLLKRIMIKNYFLYPLVSPSYVAQEFNSLNQQAVEFLRNHCSTPLIAWTIKSSEDYERIKTNCENVIFEGFTP
jgi:glycerophosphoryl diester phosphodiesterase